MFIHGIKSTKKRCSICTKYLLKTKYYYHSKQHSKIYRICAEVKRLFLCSDKSKSLFKICILFSLSRLGSLTLKHIFNCLYYGLKRSDVLFLTLQRFLLFIQIGFVVFLCGYWPSYLGMYSWHCFANKNKIFAQMILYTSEYFHKIF